jgi:uncharacterized protein with HEPN domain
MSDREWHFYLDDMIRFAEKVLAYTQGMDRRPSSKMSSRAMRLSETSR